eukprot:9948779-Lingulodinium_polyedra.AAC.1
MARPGILFASPRDAFGRRSDDGGVSLLPSAGPTFGAREGHARVRENVLSQRVSWSSTVASLAMAASMTPSVGRQASG